MSMQDSHTLSPHYEAAEGEVYSAWQLRLARRTAPIVARHFLPYVASSDSVLDFGCGGGGVVSALPCASRFGVEPNPASRVAALARGVKCEDDLAKIRSDSVDLVISNHALEHCLQPFRELGEIKRVLKSGGRFVLVVPCEDWRAEPRYRPDDHNHHLYTWTPLSIGHLVREAGFEVRSVKLERLAWPPGIAFLTWLPPFIFNVICRIWSRVSHIQEIVVVADLPNAIAE